MFETREMSVGSKSCRKPRQMDRPCLWNLRSPWGRVPYHFIHPDRGLCESQDSCIKPLHKGIKKRVAIPEIAIVCPVFFRDCNDAFSTFIGGDFEFRCQSNLAIFWGKKIRISLSTSCWRQWWPFSWESGQVGARDGMLHEMGLRCLFNYHCRILKVIDSIRTTHAPTIVFEFLQEWFINFRWSKESEQKYDTCWSEPWTRLPST